MSNPPDEPQWPPNKPPPEPSAYPPPPRYPPPPAYPPSGYQQPAGSQPLIPQYPNWAVPVQQSSGKATAALVLGVCGLVVCPLVSSIIAVVFGVQARTEIDQSGGMIGGRGNATAGIVLGWIGIALCVLGGIILAILVATESGNSDPYSGLGAGTPIAVAVACSTRIAGVS